jgi:pyrimidine operon attenuation protein/uracil phosphoribosyltransferase
MSKNIILTNQEIEHKTKRIAYQIYETFADEEEIVLAGIANSGFIFAKKIAETLESISTLKVSLCEVQINKQNPELEIRTSLTKEQYTNKGLVLIDDVLNSGTTLIYAVRHFLDVPLKKFKTAVLIDRNHKKYPVKADFKGISLSTSLLEHVQVVFDENGESYAYLS